MCLGPKKSLSPLWLELTAQGMVQHIKVQNHCDTTELFRHPIFYVCSTTLLSHCSYTYTKEPHATTLTQRCLSIARNIADRMQS